jgi:SAM-dependent methyltransferase
LVIEVTVQRALRRSGYLLLEACAALSGRRDFIPPSWLPLSGDGDFKGVGIGFFRYFVELGKLKPDDHVLDVGCGLGRMALPLTAYLDPGRGRYTGFDVDRRAIRWCQQRISPDHGNFEFQHADVLNRAYNPHGRLDGATYRFPYGEASFDFVISASVFTHMLPGEVENYLSEIARVLRPGGRSLMTFFLLNHQSIPLLDAGRSKLALVYKFEDYRLLNPKLPEKGVAHDERIIRNSCSAHGLNIVEPIHYGSWCGRDQYLSFQDIALVTIQSSVHDAT